jgi:hypothetical protein
MIYKKICALYFFLIQSLYKGFNKVPCTHMTLSAPHPRGALAPLDYSGIGFSLSK